MLGNFNEGEEEEQRTPVLSWSDAARIFCMTSMPGGRVITGGNTDGSITLWDSRTGSKEYSLAGHSESVLALVVQVELGVLFSAGADSTVRLWNLETLQNTMVFEGHRGFVVGLHAIHIDSGTGLFSGSDDRTVKQWNTNSGACVHTYKGHKGPVNAIVGDANHMYSGSSDGLLKVWNLETRRCIRTVEAHRDSIWSLSLLPDGRVISGSTDAVIKIWENLVESSAVLSELNGHRGKVRKLLVHSHILFSAGADTNINVWNLNSCSLVTTLQYHVKQISGLTLRNNQLCSAGFDKQIVRWDVSDLLPHKQAIEPYQPLSVVRNKEMEAARQQVAEVNYLRNKKRMREKTAEEIVAMHKELPVNFVVDALEFKVSSSRLSTEVLLYIPFLICFVFVFMMNRPIEDNYYMVNGIQALITTEQIPSFKHQREFASVTSSDWWYRWMNLMIVELWLDRRPGEYPSLKGQNYLIGALRVRVQRVTDKSCDFNPDLFRDIGWGEQVLNTSDYVPCFGKLDYGKTDDKTDFICPSSAPNCAVSQDDIELLGLNRTEGKFRYDGSYGTRIVAQLRTYEPGGFAVDFYFNETIEKQFAKLEAIRRLGFIDDTSTRLVDVSFYIYNPALDIFLGDQHVFETPLGGAWITVTREVGFEVFTAKDTGALVFEFFFLVFVLVFWALFINEGIDERRKGRLLGFFINAWNVMEFVNLTIFIVMYSYRWSWMTLSRSIDLTKILDRTDYSDELQASLVNYQTQVWFNAVNTVLTFLKLLKYVRLNDRLNILTRTLAACQQSLIGVLVLFVYVVFGFALTANSIYGNALFQFRSLSAAYISLLRTLLGDFDYAGMSTEYRAVTVVFFWAFVILCLFILLNFLVAVISDGFADVSQTKSAVPLDQSIAKIYSDARYECLPETLKLKLTLLRHRRTQTGIIRQTLEHLIEKRSKMVDAAAAQRQDFDELEFTMMHMEDFIALLPEDTRSYINEEFVREVWKDMAWEYHHQLLAQKGQEEQEREQIVHEEVQQALRPLMTAIPIIESMRKRLELQEAKLRPFAATIGINF